MELKIRYSGQNRQLLDSNLSQIVPVHNLPVSFVRIMLQMYEQTSRVVSFLHVFLPKPLCISLLFLARNISYPSHPSSFTIMIIIYGKKAGLQDTEIFIIQFSAASDHIFPFMSKHSVLSLLVSNTRAPCFTPIKITETIIVPHFVTFNILDIK